MHGFVHCREHRRQREAERAHGEQRQEPRAAFDRDVREVARSAHDREVSREPREATRVRALLQPLEGLSRQRRRGVLFAVTHRARAWNESAHVSRPDLLATLAKRASRSQETWAPPYRLRGHPRSAHERARWYDCSRFTSKLGSADSSGSASG